jgi:hypothetical protein
MQIPTVQDTGPSYDPVLASSHSYLGEVWDVTGSGSDAILPGGSHWLPVLPLEGVVLVPGAKLPLLATQSSEVRMMAGCGVRCVCASLLYGQLQLLCILCYNICVPADQCPQACDLPTTTTQEPDSCGEPPAQSHWGHTECLDSCHEQQTALCHIRPADVLVKISNSQHRCGLHC